MNKKKLETLAKAMLKANPEKTVCFATEDGNLFWDINHARNHRNTVLKGTSIHVFDTSKGNSEEKYEGQTEVKEPTPEDLRNPEKRGDEDEAKAKAEAEAKAKAEAEEKAKAEAKEKAKAEEKVDPQKKTTKK